MRKAVLLFMLVAVAQWAVPLWTVAGKERVLREGVPFKFKLRPIDPTDPFRGEYVVLRYAAFEGPFPLPAGAPGQGELDAYAVLENGPDGFARVHHLEMTEPASGDHVRVTGLVYTMSDTANVAVHDVAPPFDRYYLEEGGGHVAEDLVRWRPDTLGMREAYALVRVRKGEGVIEDLVIDGRPVRAWIEEARQRPAPEVAP
ncbi:MAG: GDYXXLXY domain-containing protein [Bacteroidetes bacterium]|nr:GDYXXLXY domain-containing protein [Bacteroidota bacterium]